MTIKHLYPDAWPTLNLDFANELALDPRITFSRSSVGTYVDKNGITQTAAEDEPRFDYDPVTGESLGLLIEESRTNYFGIYANPTGRGSAIFANVTDDRFINAHSWTWPTAIPNAEIYYYNPNGIDVAGDGIQYTIGVWAKASEDFTLKGNIIDSRRGQKNTHFDLTTEWQFFTASTPPNQTDNGDPKGGPAFRWLAKSSVPAGLVVYFANAQFERGGFPTSYIPTDPAAPNSTVTRAADTATVDTTGLYGDEFTIVTEPFGVASGGNPLTLYGVHNKRTSVYPRYLPQEQINTVAKVGDFWMWRVLGSSWEINPTMVGTVTVDWGDGTIEPLSNEVLASHTFTNGSGYHEVGFRLDSGSWFRVNPTADNKVKVVAVGAMPANMATIGYYSYNGFHNVVAWDANIVHTNGGPNPHELGRTYENANSLKSFPFTVLDPRITSFSQTWKGCNNLNSFPLIDTSFIDSFGQAWKDCKSLPSFPHIDTSLGENFKQAWHGCSSLLSFPSLDTSSGTSFEGAWRGCNLLTSFPSINTSSGTNFKEAWFECSNLTSFPLIDTSLGESFYNAWYRCSNLTSFPLLDTSSGTNFQGPWNGCTNLTSFPLLDTSSGTIFQAAWSNCSDLDNVATLGEATSFPLIDTSLGKNFKQTWNGCSSLTSFPLIDTSSGETFQGAWSSCRGLTSFPFLDTSSCENFKEAWTDCENLESFPLIDTSSGSDFAFSWKNCKKLTSFPAIDTSLAITLHQAWNGCTGLTSFPLLDTSLCENFGSTWAGCSNITGAFPSIDTSSATVMSFTWAGCSGLTSFPLIDTTNCTGSFTDTWINCSGLTSFPAIVCNGSTYNEAWRGCSSLTTFPPNMFDAGTVTPGFGHGKSFNQAWHGCALTAQSIENILVSLDVSGVIDSEVGINAGTNAAQSSWSTAANTALANLQAKGWTVKYNL